MSSTSLGFRRVSTLILLVAVLIVLCIALYDYFTVGSGIEYTIGDLIVICASVLLLIAAALVGFVRGMPSWLWRLLNIGIVVGIIGTGVAGYFLETDVVIALLGVALLAWIAFAFAGSRAAHPPSEAAGAHA